MIAISFFFAALRYKADDEFRYFFIDFSLFTKYQKITTVVCSSVVLVENPSSESESLRMIFVIASKFPWLFFDSLKSILLG